MSNGSIHRRGNTWRVLWRADTPEGRKQYSKGGFRTRKEAAAFLAVTLAAVKAGVFAEPTKVTLNEYIVERWLPAQRLSVRPSTYASYEAMLTRHVLPAMGRVQLQQITPDRLDRLYYDLVGAGLATKTVRNIHVAVHKALRDAVRKNLVPRNAAEAADPPKLMRSSRPEMRTWTSDELRVFLSVIAGHRIGVAYLLAATTGMRRGEVLGLRWRDVDLDNRRLHIRQTLLNINYQVSFGSPKTLRSQRTISLDPDTVRALAEHRDAQAAERRRAGGAWVDHDLVFTRPTGEPIHPDYFSQTFDRTVKRARLPKIRLHDLRHTHATLGLMAGVPVKVMSARLGHATTAFTMDTYMHVIPALADDAADQIAGLIFDRGAVTEDDRPNDIHVTGAELNAEARADNDAVDDDDDDGDGGEGPVLVPA